MLSHNLAPTRAGWFAQSGPDDDTVLATWAQLGRNIGAIPFVHRLNDQGLIHVRQTLEVAATQMDGEYHLIDGSAMSDTVRAWWVGRGVLHAGDGAAIVRADGLETLRLCDTDHVRIRAAAGGLDARSAITTAAATDRKLEELVDFAVSLRRGYLGPAIDAAGTGLSLEALVYLPTLEEGGGLSRATADHGPGRRITVQALQAGLYRASVPPIAGMDEEETVAALEDGVTRLVHYEREVRQQLADQDRSALADSAWRALGSLTHARRLGEAEAWESIGLVWVGRTTGVLESPSRARLATLLFAVQDVEVDVLVPDLTRPRDERRAELVRSVLDDRREPMEM